MYQLTGPRKYSQYYRRCCVCPYITLNSRRSVKWTLKTDLNYMRVHQTTHILSSETLPMQSVFKVLVCVSVMVMEPFCRTENIPDEYNINADFRRFTCGTIIYELWSFFNKSDKSNESTSIEFCFLQICK